LRRKLLALLHVGDAVSGVERAVIRHDVSLCLDARSEEHTERRVDRQSATFETLHARARPPGAVHCRRGLAIAQNVRLTDADISLAASSAESASHGATAAEIPSCFTDYRRQSEEQP